METIGSVGLASSSAARPSVARRMAGWAGRWLPALPLLLLVAFCLVAPALVLITQSIATRDGVGLGLWTKVLGQSVNQRAIVTSVELGLASAALSTLIGAPIAWLISRMFPGRRAFWLGLLNVAANFGGIGLAFGYVATLGTVGMLTLIVQGLGIAFAPPPQASFIALLMAYEYTNIPLFVLLTIPAMGILRDDWWEAAQTASATRFQFWRRVGMPVLLPFVGAGFLLIFTWSIGIYGIAYGLAGQSGATPVLLITLQIGTALSGDVLLGPARAGILAVVLMLIAVASLVTYRTLLRRALRWF